MIVSPDHKPEPTELYEHPEGERGRESGTPEKPRTRPEDLPAKVDAGIQAVEANLKIVPTAFGEAATHFGVAPENLVVEPDASEFAASQQQLDSAGHQMHDIASALYGDALPTEPTLPSTEPQMSPMAGTPYDPAQLPVDNGPRVDGVRTPVETAPETGSDIVIETEEAPDAPHSDTFQVVAVDGVATKPESTPLSDADRPRIIMPEPPIATIDGVRPAAPDRIVEEGYDIPTYQDFSSTEEAFFKAGEKTNETSVIDYSGYSKEALQNQREAINKELDETDMLVGKKDASGKVITQEDIDDLNRQQEGIVKALEEKAHDAEIGPHINAIFEERSKAGEGEKAKKLALFDVGNTIHLPKHLSVANETKWQIAKIVNGAYLLEQKGKDGKSQFLVTDENELAVQGISNNSYTKEYNQFRKAVFETKAKQAGAPAEGKDTKKPLRIRVDETVQLSPKLLEEKKIRSKDPVWDVSANEAGVFLLSQTDKFGITSQIVLKESELRDAGIKASKASPEKEISEKEPQAVEDPKKVDGQVMRKPSQNEYYRAVHETVLQKALQEASNNPEDYAKLAGSVVGASMRYTADGGASLIDRQGQVLKELGKDKVDEARLTILKDRLVPGLIGTAIKGGALMESQIRDREQVMQQLAEQNQTSSDEYRTAEGEVDDLKQEISKLNTWMQDLKDGKGNFSVSAEGVIQVTGPDGETPFSVDDKKAENQQNIVSLQTEKLFSTRKAIKELVGSKAVPEEFKQDVQQGNFTFAVNDAMIITVEMVGGKNDGYRFQVPPIITEGILDGSLPKGDATPDLADLQDQTKPDAVKDEEDNATEDEVEDKKPEAVQTATQEKVVQNEQQEVTEVSVASDVMRQRILELRSSERGDQVKPLIEKMHFVGAEHLAIRADNKGNLYAGLMSEDGKHMVRRLEPRIEANSEIGRLLNSDPSMKVLRKVENTVREEEPKEKAA